MENSFLWLIAIPLISSPVIYLAGRLEKLLSLGPRLQVAGAPSSMQVQKSERYYILARWLAFLSLALAWIPFALAAHQLAEQGPSIQKFASISVHLDGLSLLLAAVALGLGTLVALFSGPYIAGERDEEKYYAMLTALVGVMIGLGRAGDLFNLWVWFEAMAISSYLLVVFYREQSTSLEAGIKYLVQSAAGSMLVLLGIALVLAQTGTLDLEAIHNSVQTSPVLLAAGALFVVGFGVKIALVPLHTWLPDAHSQAPSGISAMLSGVMIEAGLVALLRALAALAGPGAFAASTWGGLLMGFGALNMLVGNLMALRQIQVKRLLAFSSLSHIGYMVLGLGFALYAGQAAGAQGSLFHLLTHGLMKSLAFLAAGALLYAVSGMGLHAASARSPHAQSRAHGPLLISDLNGAAQRYPLAAMTLSLAVLGLGGLPPLAGFMSKWQIFVAGFNTHNLIAGLLVAFAALNSVLSLAYYAPLVNAVYRKQPSAAIQGGASIPALMTVPLILLAAMVVALGIWPGLAGWLISPASSALMGAFFGG